eukprot:TRINITY_DN15940_c0_g1_i1.p1 TRINITY_DN15940_c0_g1~~TRINITY_DN15940_c0_g1_i1.p1  ORF type:complete len:143 (+),score=0.54 TRINITY_DN15940_c0_g1_i1:316-744(+)
MTIVGGDLIARANTTLVTLSPRLSIGGCLEAPGCTVLLTLADSLYVVGDVNLCGCTSLTVLPQLFYAGGDVNVSHCTSLRSLPSCMLTWPLKANLQPHVIDVTGSGVTDEYVRVWLQLARTAPLGIQIIRSEAQIAPIVQEA